MAKSLPNEAELYQKIKDEKIEIDSKIWALFYEHIGNAVTVINLISTYFLQSNNPLPIKMAKKILNYTRDINHTLDCILYPNENYLEDDLFKQLRKENVSLHPVIKEMLTHYVGNDVYGINLIIGDSLDPAAPQDVPLEHLPRVIEKTRSLRQFLDRLREATLKIAAF